MGNFADVPACTVETSLGQIQRIPLERNHLASLVAKYGFAQGVEPPTEEHLPGIILQSKRRIPVTQNHLAYLVASGAEEHPAADCFRIVLYESVQRMIYGLCKRYSSSCRDDIEDLVHDCIVQISKHIGKYNPAISSFTTWSWHVCRNLLATKSRRAGKIVELTDAMADRYDKARSKAAPHVFSSEVKQTVRNLLRKYPEQREIIYAMFGSPWTKNFSVPDKIEVSQVARTCNMPYQETYLFYRNIVRPYFRKRFDK